MPNAKNHHNHSIKTRRSTKETDSLSQRDTNNTINATNAKGSGQGRILLADEMGLGKSITALAIMLAYKCEWPLLILCPASLRYTWPAEIEKFIPSLPHSAVRILAGFDDVDWDFFTCDDDKNHNFKKNNDTKHSIFSTNESKSNPMLKSRTNPKAKAKPQIIIATYSLLQKRSAAAQTLLRCPFKCIIADESHNLKNPSSQKCQLALPLLLRAKRLLLLSGTPALSRPVELWAQLHCLDREAFGSYNYYTKRYCAAHKNRFGQWDVSGLSNDAELYKKIQQIMIRRLKGDVLQDLPQKQRTIVPITIERKHINNCKNIIAEMKNARTSMDSINDFSQTNQEDPYDAQFESRKLLMQAYKATGVGKAQAVSDILLDFLQGSSPSQKILVFAHHMDVLNTIEDNIRRAHKKRNIHIRIDGSVAPSQRAQAVQSFQTQSQIRVALLGMTAAGVGLTLTAASTVLFAELHWTPGVLAQAEDRCHRIGQMASSVNVMYCVCKDESQSLDVCLWSMLGRKIGTLGRIVDGKKNCTMNAQEEEHATTYNERNNTPTGGSVEAELTSFFADTNPSSSLSSPATTTPVKGSIQSFFVKQNRNVTPDNKSIQHESISINKNGETTSFSTIYWKCTKCTYENHNDPNSKFCEMCGTQKKRKHTEVELNFGVSRKKDNSLVWSCKACTFENTGRTLRKCAMCNTPLHRNITINQNQEVTDLSQSNPLQKCNIIQIEETEDFVMSMTRRKEVDTRLKALDTNQHEKITPSSVIDITDSDDDDDDDDDDNDDLKCMNNERKMQSIFPCEDYQSMPSHKSSLLENNKVDALLGFSVSINSGRVALHDAMDDEPLLVSFDIPDLLKENASNCSKLSSNESRLKRVKSMSQQVNSICLEFNDTAVAEVALEIEENSQKLDHTNPSKIKQLSQEIKDFLTAYVNLRQVEKKVIRESGKVIRSNNIKYQINEIIQSSSFSTSSTERYAGGEKERAIDNLTKGIELSQEQRLVLDGLACAWCAKPLSDAAKCRGVQSTYCSQKCAEEGRLKRGGIYASSKIRAQLFDLEKGICQMCNIDANALFLRIKVLQPPERLNALCNAKWSLPKCRSALERLLLDPKEFDFWQADHHIAVSEGGGGCGLENIRTLCTLCHREETSKLRARLKLNASIHSDKLKNDVNSGVSETRSKNNIQMDIRSAFSAN
eukprot:CAMPEP_0184872242 /NCGR_PEP_ID=MMETSP0580-20130426/41171_1 /TAXON_ID=1118495 /ORGANISM="Dactyliosolen fragilissimus" /LENGTH=1184 /DNA_ID=CAMNT_0027375001 /DNA_START=422 /DNA_END=3976 /DNA_ORIENTATION=-